MPVKPAIFLNYKKDYADLILDDNSQDLQKALLNHTNSMIIVKCKNMSTSSSLEIFKNLKLVKSCKKYALYETID